MSIGCVVRTPGQSARVVVGGMQQRAWLLPRATQAATGESALDEAAARAAIQSDLLECEPETDEYQLRLHTATLLKAMREAW